MIKPRRAIFATAARIRSNRPVSRIAAALILPVLVWCGGCARTDAKRTAPAALAGALRVEDPDFKLSGQREVAVVFTVTNKSRHIQRLEFPSDQRLELTLRGPDGRALFLWSEDRLFQPVPSVLTVNPGERLEYPASIPTRDMSAGRDHIVEAVLPGHPSTSATLVLRPQ
jgi:hypothetical protein